MATRANGTFQHSAKFGFSVHSSLLFVLALTIGKDNVRVF
jgi:hypothetical protein